MKNIKKVKRPKNKRLSEKKNEPKKQELNEHEEKYSGHRTNVLSGRKRKEHGAKEEYFQTFMNKIIKIDSKKKPTNQLLTKNEKKYVSKYKEYYAAIKKECEALKRWAGLTPIATIKEHRPYDKNGKLIPIATARRTLSEIRDRIKQLDFHNELTAIELSKIAEKFPDYAEELKQIKKLKGEQVSKAINDLRGPGGTNVSEQLNKALSKVKPNHPALYELRLSMHQRQAFILAYKSSVAERHKKAIKINIPSAIQISEFIIDNRASMIWEALVCAVATLTGRRPIEVIKTGSFEASDKRQHIKFDGQAKTRDVSSERKPYDIPVIGKSSPDEIIDAIAIMRAKKPQHADKTNKEINNSTSKTLNIFVREYYSNTELEVKTLRSIYGLEAEKTMYEEFKGDRSIDQFRSDIFGHQDIDTQTIYGAIQADWSEPKSSTPTINPFEVQREQELEAMNRLKERVLEAKERIIALQKRGNAQESLMEFVLENLNKGEFVTKTRMERPDGVNSVRSRKTITAFISQLKGGWPSKLEELYSETIA